LIAAGQAQLDPGQGQPDRARPALAVIGLETFMTVSVMP
jgi:hypothetical protein